MSHCSCCDKVLSTFEMTRKNKTTGEYFMMCNECFSYVKPYVKSVDRKDLATTKDFEEDIDKQEIDGYFISYRDSMGYFDSLWEDR